MRTIIMIAIMLSFLLISCNKHGHHSVDDARLIEIYEHVGDLHNRGLDIVYTNLRNGSIYDSATFKTILDDFLTKELNADASKEDYLVFPKAMLVSRNIKEFTNELDKLLYNIQDNNVTILRDKFMKERILTLTEKRLIIGMTSVAKASTAYWNVNVFKWKALRSNPMLNSPETELSKIVVADAKGAAVGAVRGAWIGATGGTMVIPGIGTVTGAVNGGLVGMAGGAIIASAGALIDKWIMKWFDGQIMYAVPSPDYIAKGEFLPTDTLWLTRITPIP